MAGSSSKIVRGFTLWLRGIGLVLMVSVNNTAVSVVNSYFLPPKFSAFFNFKVVGKPHSQRVMFGAYLLYSTSYWASNTCSFSARFFLKTKNDAACGRYACGMLNRMRLNDRLLASIKISPSNWI